ncbi:MAG: DUF2807 domain-containing protein [Flavobacteriales bacterium]|nr:DUF2807 domain-containing protein [Flavobacteriales bacterium]
MRAEVTDSDKVRKEDRNHSNFSGIHVSSGIDVKLKQGQNYAVTIEASESVLSTVSTEVEDEILIITRGSKDKVDSFFDNLYGNGNINVYVTLPMVDFIKASSGSDIDGDGAFKVDDIKINLSSGSDLKMSLDAKNMSVSISSGSDMDLTGTARSLKVKATSGSDLDADNFQVEECSLFLSSGSDVSIDVTKILSVKASGGSDVKYKGNPQITSQDVSGASDLKKIN